MTMSGHVATSRFSRNAVVMLGASLVSQLLVLGAMPFFTRVYSPSAIGVAALFMSWAISLSVLGTMRLDLAAVLPESSREASVLVRLILLQSVALAVAITLVVLVWGGHIGRALGDPDAAWMWFVGPMCVVLAMSQASIAVATRDRSFGKIALLSICTSAGFAVFGCLLWFMDVTADGLVLARLAAQVAGVLVAVGLGLLSPLREGPRLTWALAKRTYRRFHQFLVFNTPYSFFSSVAGDLPIFIFSFVNSTGTAAAYALAKMVLIAPTRLVSSALSQVFYKEAVDFLNQPRLELLARRMLWVGLMFGFPAFAVVTVWGDVLFAAVFGPNWDYAGRVAMILSPAMWLCMQTGWVQRIFEATGRQKLSFSIQGIFDAIVIVSMVTLLTVMHQLTAAIAVYAVLFGANNIAYLIAGIRAARFTTRPFLIDLVIGAALYLGFVVIGGLIRSSTMHTVPALALTGGAAAVVYLAAALAFHRKFGHKSLEGSVMHDGPVAR